MKTDERKGDRRIVTEEEKIRKERAEGILKWRKKRTGAKVGWDERRKRKTRVEG